MLVEHIEEEITNLHAQQVAEIRETSLCGWRQRSLRSFDFCKCVCVLRVRLREMAGQRSASCADKGEKTWRSLKFNHKRRKMTSPSKKKIHKQPTQPRVVHSVKRDIRTLRPFNCDVSFLTVFHCSVTFHIHASRSSDIQKNCSLSALRHASLPQTSNPVSCLHD